MKRHVDIVGGGLAGLLAAIELSRAGVQVAVWESASEFGGRARTRDVDGFLFNRGPHALYCNGALKRELDRFGISYSGGRSLSGARKAIARSKLYLLPMTLGSIVRTSLFGFRDKLKYIQVFKSVMRGESARGSFAEWLDERHLPPTVRATVEAIGRLSGYANGSANISANALLDQIRVAAGGTIYLDGGWISLVKGLVASARAAGVELHDRTSVKRVSYVEGALVLTLADGDYRPADAVILAIGPREAATLAPEFPSLQEEAMEARAIRANTLDLALSRMPDQANDFALGIDSPFYLSVHSGSARLAPENGVLVHIAKYLAIDEEPSKDTVGELEAIADLVMPGWRELEVSRQKLRGMVVSHALPRSDRLRAGVEVQGAPGLFLAGDWVGEEGMLADAAAASAIKAARLALQWIKS